MSSSFLRSIFPKKMAQNNLDEKDSYFPFHRCFSSIYKLPKYKKKGGPIRMFIFKLITVRTKDIRSHYMYRSHAALCAEKARQFNKYPYTIHPFSTLRLYIEIIVAIDIMVSSSVLAYWFAKSLPVDETHFCSKILSACDYIYVINLIANFVTGYVEGKHKQFVVLKLKKILLRYAVTWMPLDIFSLLCVIIVETAEEFTLDVIFMSMKVFRVPIMYVYIHNILKVSRAGVITKTAVELVFCFYTYLIWNIYFQFSWEYLIEGTTQPESPRNCSWITIAQLWNATDDIRCFYALERAVGMLRENANLNLIQYNGCFEVFFIIFWMIAKCIVFHCALTYMLALFGTESARAKYYIMAQQVQTYVNQRRFPPRLKKKVLKFYAIRFQSHFFVESRMMACVSGQLREDMIMHTGRQLVRDVTFLKQLPRSLLMQIGVKFKLVIFIAGDIIFKINTVGDCIYFIHKGTVAIYSESGWEVCHLEDGDYFGEIALIMKHRFRSASAVAVTNCELFSLSREDFESIACYPMVYEDIKKEATSRLERMCVVDEQYKVQMKVINKEKKGDE